MAGPGGKSKLPHLTSRLVNLSLVSGSTSVTTERSGVDQPIDDTSPPDDRGTSIRIPSMDFFHLLLNSDMFTVHLLVDFFLAGLLVF